MWVTVVVLLEQMCDDIEASRQTSKFSRILFGFLVRHRVEETFLSSIHRQVLV